MAEAALQTKVEEAEDAVVKADAAVAKAQKAFDEAVGDNRALCGQLLVAEKNGLVAEKNALIQLREQELIQQRASTGSYCFQLTICLKHSVMPLKSYSLVCGLRFCCFLMCSYSLASIAIFLQISCSNAAVTFLQLHSACQDRLQDFCHMT